MKTVHIPRIFFSPHIGLLFPLVAIGTSGLGRLCPWCVRDPSDDHVNEANEGWHLPLSLSKLNPMGVRATADPVFRASLVPRSSDSIQNLGLPRILTPRGVGHGVNSPIKDIYSTVYAIYTATHPKRRILQISTFIPNLRNCVSAASPPTWTSRKVRARRLLLPITQIHAFRQTKTITANSRLLCLSKKRPSRTPSIFIFLGGHGLSSS